MLDKISPTTCIVLRLDIGILNAVHAKYPEVLPQFTPTGDITPILNKSQRDRPYYSFGGYTIKVSIRDQNFALFMHRLSQERQIDGSRPRLSMTNMEAHVVELISQFCRKHSINFREQILRRLSEFVIRLTTDPFDTKRQSLKLFLREHQRRKQKSGFQNISDARFPFDVRAYRLQGCDVAADGPQRDSHLKRKRMSGHRLPVPAQYLHEAEYAMTL